MKTKRHRKQGTIEVAIILLGYMAMALAVYYLYLLVNAYGAIVILWATGHMELLNPQHLNQYRSFLE